MNTKERIDEFLGERDAGGGVLPVSLLSDIIDKVPFKDILSLRNNLIDEKFKLIMQDSDMVTCIEEFFKYDLNVAETSRNSFLHRNTLLYRLAKIHTLTGLNIRKFEDAVTFKLLIKIFKLTS